MFTFGLTSAALRRTVTIVAVLGSALPSAAYAASFYTRATAMGDGGLTCVLPANGGVCVDTGRTQNLDSTAFAEVDAGASGHLEGQAQASLTNFSVGVRAIGGINTTNSSPSLYSGGTATAQAELQDTFVFDVPLANATSFTYSVAIDGSEFSAAGNRASLFTLLLLPKDSAQVARSENRHFVHLGDLFSGQLTDAGQFSGGEVASIDGRGLLQGELLLPAGTAFLEVNMAITAHASRGAIEFLNTAAFNVEFPTTLAVTRASGLPVRPSVSVPAPSTLLLLGSALLAAMRLRASRSA